MNAIDYATDLYQSHHTQFFAERGINEQTVHEWRLGFAPAQYDMKNGPVPESELKSAGLLTEQGRPRFFNRGMFPIFDDRGEAVSFGGRYLGQRDDVPKYLNGPETDWYHKDRVLYGMDKIKPQFTVSDKFIPGKPALIVEGYMDVLSVHQAGYQKVLGACGTSVTRGQMEFVKGLTTEVFFMYDGDKAGRQASIRGAERAIEVGVFPYIISLEQGTDPDDLARLQGLDGILQHIERKRYTFAEHLWFSIDRQDIGRRCAAIRYALKVIYRCPDPLIRIMLIDDLAYTFDVARNVIMADYEQLFES